MSRVIKRKEYEFHPLSMYFPLMNDTGLRELADDIKENGLQEKIELLDDQIFDGRNRYLACRIAAVKPEFINYDEKKKGNPYSYLISKNIRRRHLTTEQKIDIALTILEDQEKARQQEFEEMEKELLEKAKTEEEKKEAKRIIDRKRIMLDVEKHKGLLKASRDVGTLPKKVYQMKEIKDKSKESAEIRKKLREIVTGKTSIEAVSREIKGKPRRITMREKIVILQDKMDGFKHKIDTYETYIRKLIDLVEEASSVMPDLGDDVKELIDKVNREPFIKAIKNIDRSEDGGAAGWTESRWEEEKQKYLEKLSKEK